MQQEIFFVLVLVVLILAILGFAKRRYYSSKSTTSKLPPSPFQLPFVGVMPFISPNALHETFGKWADKMGKIFCCRFGPQLQVVLNDFQLVKQVCGSTAEAFAGRPNFFLIKLAQNPSEPQSKGIILSEGDSWKAHRRFALKVFRSFGVGTNAFEDVIMEEAAQLVNDFEQQSDRPFENELFIKKAVGNVVAYILFGKRFTSTDETFVGTVKFVDQTIEENMGGAALMNFYPWMRHIPAFRKVYDRLKDELRKHWQRISALIKSRGELPLRNSDLQNYTDAYLTHQETTGDPLFTDFQMQLMIGEIFAAGFSTTAATLRWALLFLADNPQLQSQLQTQLDLEVGKDRPVRWSDRLSTPLLEATIMEVQRIATVAPFSIPRRATQDGEIDGYHIAAESVIMPNLWYIHHDARNFAAPDKFHPERFLDQNGKVFTPDAFMPFGTGIRSCPGEQLARMELYIFLGSLLQNFTLTLPNGSTASYQPKPGSTYDAQPYHLIAKRR